METRTARTPTLGGSPDFDPGPAFGMAKVPCDPAQVIVNHASFRVQLPSVPATRSARLARRLSAYEAVTPRPPAAGSRKRPLVWSGKSGAGAHGLLQAVRDRAVTTSGATPRFDMSGLAGAADPTAGAAVGSPRLPIDPLGPPAVRDSLAAEVDAAFGPPPVQTYPESPVSPVVPHMRQSPPATYPRHSDSPGHTPAADPAEFYRPEAPERTGPTDEELFGTADRSGWDTPAVEGFRSSRHGTSGYGTSEYDASAYGSAGHDTSGTPTVDLPGQSGTRGSSLTDGFDHLFRDEEPATGGDELPYTEGLVQDDDTFVLERVILAGDADDADDPHAEASSAGDREARAAARAERHTYYPGRRMNLGVVLLPLRVFLGLISVYAGMGKLCDPVYFDGGAKGSLVTWLTALDPWPLAEPLRDFALQHPVGSGLTVAFLQILVGVLTVLGLWQRLAAGVGALLSAALLVTVSWRTGPVYDSADIIYLAAWSPLLIAGAPVYSADGRLAAEAWRTLGPRVALHALRSRVLRRGALLAAATAGITLVVGAMLGAAVRDADRVTVPGPGQAPRNQLPGTPLPQESGKSEENASPSPSPTDETGADEPERSAGAESPAAEESSTGAAPGAEDSAQAPEAPAQPEAPAAPAEPGSSGTTGGSGGSDGGSTPGGSSGSGGSGSDGGSGSGGGSDGGSGALGGLLG